MEQFQQSNFAQKFPKLHERTKLSIVWDNPVFEAQTWTMRKTAIATLSREIEKVTSK